MRIVERRQVTLCRCYRYRTCLQRFSVFALSIQLQQRCLLTLVRREGIEPSSQVWKTHVIAIIPSPQFLHKVCCYAKEKFSLTSYGVPFYYPWLDGIQLETSISNSDMLKSPQSLTEIRQELPFAFTLLYTSFINSLASEARTSSHSLKDGCF